MNYDLIIKNGTVIDGSGMPRFRADVGIAGGKSRRLARFATVRRRRSTPTVTS
jgi:N-acyl-D-aspartate/D-glutamate deacylase